MADIAINPVVRRVQFTGNTGLGPFAFTFNILQNTDIVVYKNRTLLTLTTDYTVSIDANGTGSVTLTGSGSGTALVADDVFTLIGGRELSRTTDFVTAGDLLASSLNEQLDSNVIMSQQLDERFSRTIRVNPGDADKTLEVPSVADRADKILKFDSSGNIGVETASALFSGAVVGANFTNNTFTGDGSQTAFTTTVQAGSKNNAQVYIDGVYQLKSSFSVSGLTLTFTEAPPLNSQIEVIIGNAIDNLDGDSGNVNYNQGGTGAQTRTVESKLQDVVSVKDFGATGDGVTDDTAAINAAIATGKDVFFPDTSSSYKITSALTPLSRWQWVSGTGYTKITADTSTDYAVFTVTTNNIIEKLYIEGSVKNGNVTGIKFSAGTLAADMSSQNKIKDVWLRFLNKGIDFDNGFTNSLYTCEMRDNNIGLNVVPTPSDTPSSGYSADLNLYDCRFYNNSSYDVYYYPPTTGRASSFVGCTFDPMDGTPAASVYLRNAVNSTFSSCYHEAGASTWAVDFVSSTNCSINGCLFNDTKGISLNAAHVAIRDCWSSNTGADATDAIIANTTPASDQLQIDNSRFLSTAHDFESISTLRVTNSTLRIDGANTLFTEGLLKSWTPSYSSGFTSPTYNAQQGYYVRQGDIVTVWFYVNLSGGTPSGDAQITLPFTSKNLSPSINNQNGVLHVQSCAGITTNAPILRVGNNSDILHLQVQDSTGVTNISGAHLGSTATINGTITYNIA